VSPTIDDILLAHRRGEAEATERLIEYCHEHVLFLARRLLPSFARVARHERPSDIAQDVMIALLQALKTTKPESERHLFLLAGKKVRETLHDLARKHAGKRHGLGNQEVAAFDAHTACVADEKLTGPETLDDWTRFHQAVESLPEDERNIMLLKWFLGASENEIAEILDCSRSTVQRLWSAAKTHITTAMGCMPPR
jgi:RNA polymerase sigma factor (sigma-70 family)